MKKALKEVLTYKRIWLLLLMPIALLLTVIVKNSSFVAEYVFARGIYRVLATAISFVTGLIPFSIGELLVILVPVAFFVSLSRFSSHLYSDWQNRATIIGSGILNLLCVISVLFFSYTMLCGLNYHRYSFAHYEGVTVTPSSVEELYELCETLVIEANTIKGNIDSVDEDGAYKSAYTDHEIAMQAKETFDKLADRYDIFEGLVTKPKPILLSRLMSYTEITGIYFPFTVEANVNVDIPDDDIPVTMCHELAHLFGFMREDEANYIAYLACMESDQPHFQYSGTMLALAYASDQLYSYDKELYGDVIDRMDITVKRDIRRSNEYWAQFDNEVVSTVASKVNDAYLRANEQNDGVNSYGRMVDLLLARQRKVKQ